MATAEYRNTSGRGRQLRKLQDEDGTRENATTAVEEGETIELFEEQGEYLVENEGWSRVVDGEDTSERSEDDEPASPGPDMAENGEREEDDEEDEYDGPTWDDVTEELPWLTEDHIDDLDTEFGDADTFYGTDEDELVDFLADLPNLNEDRAANVVKAMNE